MLAFLQLCLLLATVSPLVSSKPTPLSPAPAVYNNCSGNQPSPFPNDVASTPFFKPQLHVNPLDKKAVGWEEWLLVGHSFSTNGSGPELIYSCKWSLGDPASANTSLQTFSGWVYFPNGTVYSQIVHDVFKYQENADGGFTYSVANNHLTWDPVHRFWNTSVNANGWIIETSTLSVEPNTPFSPNYKSVPGQISEGFFSRIDLPRGHTDGTMLFPWGQNVTIFSIGNIKHSWNKKPKADVISAYVRGSIFIPLTNSTPITTVVWYQAWDLSGNEIDSIQFSLEPDYSPNDQALRVQITDAPDLFSVVTDPKPASLPLSYYNTEVSLPMCQPGVDFDTTDQRMSWTFNNQFPLYNFVDSAGGVTLYQKVNMTGAVWFDGALLEINGYTGDVEIYHR